MSIIKRSKRIVSVDEYKETGKPIDLGVCNITCPYDEQKILRMAIMVDGGKLKIPSELKWLDELFNKALECQNKIINVSHSFCYITVRHGVVDSLADDEWHVDGFSTKITHIPEQNYIWSNIMGTEIAEVNVDFPNDFNPNLHNVNHFLENFISNSYNCKDNNLYCLDPFILHRRQPTTKGMNRTFVRISFVPIEIDDINNSPNPLIERNYKKDGVKLRNKLLTYCMKNK